MNITKEERTVWRTSDGVDHSSFEMAEQHVANADLCSALYEALGAYGKLECDAQDVLNCLSQRRSQVRAWLDACDAMEKAGLT